MLFETWAGAVVRTTAGLALVAALVSACGEDNAAGGAATPSSEPTGSSASAPSPRTDASAGECSPPTTDVTYATGAAVLNVADGPHAGDYELTIDADRPEDNAYVTGFGEQLIGNWRGGGLEDDLPALEVRMLNQGDVCQGPPIVRVYLPFLAYEDNDSVACTGGLDTLSTTAASGHFECTGLPRTFGSAEPETLDASGTFSLGS